MTTCFFDTSGIVKRYVKETGSAWVNQVVDPAMKTPIHMARITAVEVASAITRQQRKGNISSSDAAVLLAQFLHDFVVQYRKVEISPSLVLDAMNLAAAHGLRAYDAVQLAAAMRVHARCRALGSPFSLVSADAALIAAASAEGLSVDDPNSHP